jgi:PKD repeat protein
MKKLLLSLIISFFYINTFSQNCNSTGCTLDPMIVQDNLNICYSMNDSTLLDSNGVPIQNTWSNYFCQEECFTVCENSTYTYSTEYNFGSSYNWTVTGGQLISQNNTSNSVQVQWDVPGSGTVEVHEIDSITGCSGYTSICVIIVPIPIAQIIISDSIVCQNSNIQFFSENLNSNTLQQQIDSCNNSQWWNPDSTLYYYDMEYIWDFGDGSISTDQNPIHSYLSAGTYIVTLIMSNSCQCSDTISLVIQVTNESGPDITSCFGTVCEGDTIEYCTDAILPLWEIIGGTLYNSSNTDACILIIWDNFDGELNDGEGEILLSDLNTNCGTSSSVFNIPIVPVNAELSGATKVCPNDIEKYSFTDLCIPGVDYNWYIIGNAGSIVNGQNTSEVTIEWYYNTTTVQQIVLDISAPDLNCPSATATLYVNVKPPIEIYGSNSVCEDITSSYYEYSGQSFEWEVSNGSLQSSLIGTQADVLWDQGSGSAYVKAIAIDTTYFCMDSKTFMIDVLETPQSINNIIGETLICPGEEYFYVADPSNDNSSTQSIYNWTITGGSPASWSGDDCFITWNTTGPYSIDITNTSQNGCQSSPFVKTINELSISPPVIVGSFSACPNTNTTFTLGSPYSDDVRITWSLTNSTIGSIVSGKQEEEVEIEWGNQSGNTDIKVTIEVCGTNYISSSLVTLAPLNNADFTTNTPPLCSESSILFDAVPSSGTFTWNFGDGTPPVTQGSSSISHIFDDPGLYNVTLSYQDPTTLCTSTQFRPITILGITGSIVPNTLSVCSPQDLYYEYANGEVAIAHWYFNGSFLSSSVPIISSTTLTPSISNASSLGLYTLVLEDQNGCLNTINDDITLVSCPPGSGGGPPSGGGGGGGGGGGTPSWDCDPIYGCIGNSSGTGVYSTYSACTAVSYSIMGLPWSYSCGNNGDFDITYTSPIGTPVNFYPGGFGPSLTYIKSYSKAGLYKTEFQTTASCPVTFGDVTHEVPFAIDWDFTLSCDSSANNQITVNFDGSDVSKLTSLEYSVMSFTWDLGDGTISTDESPTHIYSAAGTYTVDLLVSWGSWSCNFTKDIIVPDFNPVYNYSVSPYCEKTPTVYFQDLTPSNLNVIDWQWNMGDGYTVSNDSIVNRTYDTSGTFMTSLTITNSDGCQITDSLPITIFPRPLLDSISDVNKFCLSSPALDLSTIVHYTIINGETISWTGTGITQIAGVYYFDPFIAGADTHTVCFTLINSYGCYYEECVDFVVVCPDTDIFGTSEFCAGDNMWTRLSTNPDFVSYTWYMNSSQIDYFTSPSGYSDYLYYYLSNASPGTYYFNVSVVDAYGCTSDSDPYEVNIYPYPNPPSISSNSTPCPGQELILSHNGSQSGVDYYWNTIPQQELNIITVIAESNFEYQVTSINQWGCISYSSVIEIPDEINLCSVLSGCYCDSSLMDASTGLINISGLPNYWNYSSYEWLQDGISFIPPEYGSSLSIDPSDPNYLNFISGNISLSVSDYFGCSNESNNLIIEPNCISCLLSQSVFNVNSEICLGDTLYIGNNSYSSPGYYTDSLLSTQGCDSIINTSLTVFPILTSNQYFDICQGDSIVIGLNIYDSAGVYIDTLSSINNCDSLVFTHINISIPDPQIILTGNSLQLSVIGGIAPYTIEVGNQNGVIVTASLNTTSLSYYYNPIINGLYYFIVIDDLGCISDTIFYLVDIFPTLINEFGINSLNIFPNPSRDVFNVEFTSDSKQSIEVRVVNLIGEEIFTENLENFEGEYTHSFNLSEYSKGVYLLEITTDNGVIKKKLILQ